jgi:hypothetical protein
MTLDKLLHSNPAIFFSIWEFLDLILDFPISLLQVFVKLELCLHVHSSQGILFSVDFVTNVREEDNPKDSDDGYKLEYLYSASLVLALVEHTPYMFSPHYLNYYTK